MEEDHHEDGSESGWNRRYRHVTSAELPDEDIESATTSEPAMSWRRSYKSKRPRRQAASVTTPVLYQDDSADGGLLSPDIAETEAEAAHTEKVPASLIDWPALESTSSMHMEQGNFYVRNDDKWINVFVTNFSALNITVKSLIIFIFGCFNYSSDRKSLSNTLICS